MEIRDGVPIGFIGVTAEGPADPWSPRTAIKGLKFGDEVKADNRYADMLNLLGIKARSCCCTRATTTGVERRPRRLHELPGPGQQIAEKVSPKIDAVFSGHSHQQYNCTVKDPAGNPRPFIQGRVVRPCAVRGRPEDRPQDPRRRPVGDQGRQQDRHPDVTPDPAVQAVVDKAKTKSGPIANKQIGTIAADIVRARAADRRVAARRPDRGRAARGDPGNGAQIALMNPGGIRADLTYPVAGAARATAW